MTEELRDWDIVSGVGITALAVAASRAIETSRPEPLARDPFAAAFVEAANPPEPMPTRVDAIPPGDRLWTQMSMSMALRSRFFDDYYADSWRSGVRQFVIVAAGLDCRAFRLDWPADAVIFEVDLPRVLEFKDRVLAGLGARAKCERHTVAADLRDDWPAALAAAGFDPARPTGWLAEGLMPYLPEDAAERLIDTVHRLSAPGSTIAIEHMDNPKSTLDDPRTRAIQEEYDVDLGMLFADVAHSDPEGQLAALGWQVTGAFAGELAERYGRSLEGAFAEEFAEKSRYSSGTLP